VIKRFIFILVLLNLPVLAGPYNESGIWAWIDAFWNSAPPPGSADYASHPDPNSIRIHPLFRGWATGYRDYRPSGLVNPQWTNPQKALGPATGNPFDIVSLGDLSETELAAGALPGRITLTFGDPNDPSDPRHIRNGKGSDFAVFENAILSQVSTGGGSIAGRMMAELAFVEVSTNGMDFARIQSISRTSARVGPYGTIDVTDVFNLAGKHPNADGVCMGTPFDLDDLRDHPLVAAGRVDLNDIRFVRLVDIPGSGAFADAPAAFPDPATWDPNSLPHFKSYVAAHPIFDAWLTFGSGGFDLEAVGVLQEQQYSADLNFDGRIDDRDWDLFVRSWGMHFGQPGFVARSDLAEPKDFVVDIRDMLEFTRQWLSVESWRTKLVNDEDLP
jgi:hypothetical protein